MRRIYSLKKMQACGVDNGIPQELNIAGETIENTPFSKKPFKIEKRFFKALLESL
jgi:hypothetical protein